MGLRPEGVWGMSMRQMRGLSMGHAPGRKVLISLTAVLALSACASKPHHDLNETVATQPVPAADDASDHKKKKHHRKKKDEQAAAQASDASSSSSQSVAPVPEAGSMHSSTDQNNNWGDAFTAPLEDLNLKRQAIPAILENSISRPYDLTGLDTCEAIAGQVAQLDALLGADFDEPPPPKGAESLTDRSQRMANNYAVGAVRSASRSIIPFRGIVRKMTGAERHQKELDTAIQAGKVRRAYLKGVGMNKNCAPPAAPSWFKPNPVANVPVADPPPLPEPSSRKQRKTK